MWTTCVCLMALSFPPAQGGELEIVNGRSTYGFLGAPRPKTGVLPGDVLHFAFDIKGLKLDAKGRAEYTLLMEVTNDKGELIFKEGPRNSVAQSYLGGDTLPVAANLEIPLQTKPGTHTLKVTITDRATDKKLVFEGKGQVLEPEFGLVRVGTFADAATTVPTSPVAVVGETIHISFAPINFARDKESKQPHLEMALRVLDDKGQPTYAEPLTGEVKSNVPAEIKMLPMRFGLTLNRVGQFEVELTARDKLSGKSAKVTFPIKVTTIQ
jgi:hypothetical protein